MSKSRDGNFFEDFELGQVIEHATPRTVTTGDVSLYTALYGSRFGVQSSDAFAQAIGYPRSPVDDVLVFHIVFGKTVPDVSLNAVANLGYAECRFLKPVYPGDTLSATSEVIGFRENSNKQSGVVYVRTTGRDQDGKPVLEFARWVMVRKRNENAPAPAEYVPQLRRWSTQRHSEPRSRRSTSTVTATLYPEVHADGGVMRSAKRLITSMA